MGTAVLGSEHSQLKEVSNNSDRLRLVSSCKKWPLTILVHFTMESTGSLGEETTLNINST